MKGAAPTLILVMAPAMWGLKHLVRWADRLYAWEYSPRYVLPTAADYTRATVVFWASLSIPLAVATVAAIQAFRRKTPAVWPLLESGIIVAPYLALIAGMALGVSGFTAGPPRGSHLAEAIVWFVMLWACVLVGGAVAASGHNFGACLRHRAWGRLAVSAVAMGAGMLYLCWLSGFIIYIDT